MVARRSRKRSILTPVALTEMSGDPAAADLK